MTEINNKNFSSFFIDKIITSNPSWMEEGLCNESSLDFMKPSNEEECKNVCKQCPVRKVCLDYSIQTGVKFGVFGGIGPSDREPD